MVTGSEGSTAAPSRASHGINRHRGRFFRMLPTFHSHGRRLGGIRLNTRVNPVSGSRWTVPIICAVVALFTAGRPAVMASEPEQVSPREVTVYAAASLTNVLQAVADRLLEAEGIRLRFSFAGSSALARQIENGAPTDLFASANARWMAYLEARGLIDSGSRIDLLGNRLVVVAPAGEAFPVRAEKGFDFPGAFEGRLAIADPDHVPAGIYGRQALSSLGWWTGVAGRLAPALDVRGSLGYVERGACPAGIVYRTDAAASDRVVVLAELPAWSHDPIVYPVAALTGRLGPEAARVLAFLRSESAIQVFREHGFLVPGG
jgi:molybdate transport system substrate-binding protein